MEDLQVKRLLTGVKACLDRVIAIRIARHNGHRVVVQRADRKTRAVVQRRNQCPQRQRAGLKPRCIQGIAAACADQNKVFKARVVYFLCITCRRKRQRRIGQELRGLARCSDPVIACATGQGNLRAQRARIRDGDKVVAFAKINAVVCADYDPVDTTGTDDCCRSAPAGNIGPTRHIEVKAEFDGFDGGYRLARSCTRPGDRRDYRLRDAADIGGHRQAKITATIGVDEVHRDAGDLRLGGCITCNGQLINQRIELAQGLNGGLHLCIACIKRNRGRHQLDAVKTFDFQPETVIRAGVQRTRRQQIAGVGRIVMIQATAGEIIGSETIFAQQVVATAADEGIKSVTAAQGIAKQATSQNVVAAPAHEHHACKRQRGCRHGIGVLVAANADLVEHTDQRVRKHTVVSNLDLDCVEV